MIVLLLCNIPALWTRMAGLATEPYGAGPLEALSGTGRCCVVLVP